MPISAIDTYSAEHWSDIKQILLDVIESAGFVGNLVSDAEETNVIQKTIVQNIYNSDIVICDISGKNPNVMFELGMRLAFDKATIVIKDYDTGFSFDTSPIEHLLYPRDLRFQSIIDFKEKLKAKIIATYNKSKTDPHYSTFLKSFGEFTIAKLESNEVSPNEFLIKKLEDIKNEIKFIRINNSQSSIKETSNSKVFQNLIEYTNKIVIRLPIDSKAEVVDNITNILEHRVTYQSVNVFMSSPKHEYLIEINFNNFINKILVTEIKAILDTEGVHYVDVYLAK